MPQKEKLVTVIVPVYRVEGYMEKSVRSILEQTYSNLEIILVDDGSPDRCGEMCDAFAREDDRIVVVHKENEGAGHSRNAALDIARGEYVTFVDADDWIGKKRIETMVAAAEEAGADLVSTGRVRAFSETTQRELPICQTKKVYRGKQEVLEGLFYPVLGKDADHRPNHGAIDMSVWCNLYRREQIETHALRFRSERECLSEDLFFNLEYHINVECAVLIPDCSYYYRYNQTSFSQAYRPMRVGMIQTMFQRIYELLDRNDLREGAGYRVERAFMMYIRHELMLASDADISAEEKYERYHEALTLPLTGDVCSRYPHIGIPMRERLMVKLIEKKRIWMLQRYLELQTVLVKLRDSRR